MSTPKTTQDALARIRRHLGEGVPIALSRSAVIDGWAAGRWLGDARGKARKLGPESPICEALTQAGVDVGVQRTGAKPQPLDEVVAKLAAIRDHVGPGVPIPLDQGLRIGGWNAGAWLVNVRRRAAHGAEPELVRVLSEAGVAAIVPRPRRGRPQVDGEGRELLRIRAHVGHDGDMNLPAEAMIGDWPAGVWLQTMKELAKRRGPSSALHQKLSLAGISLGRAA